MIDYLDPRAESSIAVEPYALGVDLEARGGTVAYLANGFPDSERFLKAIADAIARRMPALGAAHWNKRNASITASDDMLDEIEGQCQAAIAAYGH